MVIVMIIDFLIIYLLFNMAANAGKQHNIYLLIFSIILSFIFIVVVRRPNRPNPPKTGE